MKWAKKKDEAVRSAHTTARIRLATMPCPPRLCLARKESTGKMVIRSDTAEDLRGSPSFRLRQRRPRHLPAAPKRGCLGWPVSPRPPARFLQPDTCSSESVGEKRCIYCPRFRDRSSIHHLLLEILQDALLPDPAMHILRHPHNQSGRSHAPFGVPPTCLEVQNYFAGLSVIL